MVAVYLLGHRVGDIEEPVVYVNRKAYDYNGREVTKGIPDPFINSLTHDCIIVQIPLLRNNFHNRLDKVLSIFDQTKKEKDNRQMLDIDEELYGDDEEMLYLLRRLLAAASESSVRQDMNVEDEYFSAIETRDTAILNRDKIIKEKEKTIAEKEGVIAEKEGVIAEKEGVIAEKEGVIAEKEGVIAEKDSQIAEKDSQIADQINQLRAMAKALLNAGHTVDDISRITGKPIEIIKDLI